MLKNQKGFSVIELLVVVIFLSIVGFIGWKVWTSRNGAKSPSNTTQNSSRSSKTEVKDTWLTYKNDEAKITFQYPETWKSESSDTFRYDDGSFGGVGGSLTSPSGNKLSWIFQVAGGKGGDCEPAPADKPFAQGNKCASKQIISVEKAQTVKSPGTTFRNMFEDSLFITRTKYMSTDNKVSYQICLDPYYTSQTDAHDDGTPHVGTQMGLLFPCAYWDTGFNAKFVVANEGGFKSADAKTAEQIMKTFNSL